jgi:signal transduction histidine kinase/CheY-like chemotaxis protein
METALQTDISRVSADLQSEFIRSLDRPIDLAGVLDDLVERAEKVLRADACTVFTIDVLRERAVQQAGSGYQRQFNGKDDIHVLAASAVSELPKKGEALGLTGWILSTGKPFLARTAADFESHPHHSGRYDDIQLPGEHLRIHSFLGVPFRGLRGEVVGMIKAERRVTDRSVPGTGSSSGTSFSVEDELALETIAIVAARCITYIDMAQRQQTAQAITAWAREIIAEAAASQGELDNFLEIAVKATAAAMGADSCGVFLQDESGKTLTQRAGIGSQAQRSVIRAYPWPDDSLIPECKNVARCSPPDCPYGRPWHDQERFHPALLHKRDLRDAAALVAKLRGGQDQMSQFLAGCLSPDAQKVLTNADATREELDESLLRELNRIILGESLFHPQRFTAVKLSAESRKLIAKTDPSGQERERTNRLLLEDAYPSEIARRVGLTAWIAATGKKFHASNPAELSRHCHHKGQYDQWNFPPKTDTECGAFLGVPLHIGGTTIGVIKVENTSRVDKTDPRDFSKDAQQRFEILAQDVALSITRLQTQIPARYEIIQKAQQTIIEIVRGGLELADLVNRVVTETRALFHAGACALFLREGNFLRQPNWAASGWAQSGLDVREYELVPLQTVKRNPTSDDEKIGLTVWIAVTREQFTARSNTELRMHPHHKGTFDAYNFPEGEQCESFMGSPLLANDELVGVLKVETKKRTVDRTEEYTYFNELDKIVFDLIAKSAAIAIQNARLQRAAAEATENAWKQFSAMAAHRTGSEAADIRGALRWLREDLAKTGVENIAEPNLGRIGRALNRIDTFVQEFTQFTRTPDLTLERLNINDICVDAKSQSAAAGAERVQVDMRLASGLPLLWGDREKLLYSFKELFQNAVRAMSDKPERRLVIATNALNDGATIRIEFTDSGDGVAPGTKERIFEPGFRGRPGGTGLGLAIVHTTIKQHRGTIREAGTHGRGAHFVIELPVRVPEGATPERILIVDDNQAFRLDLEKIVKWDAPGRRVVAASNEHEAKLQLAKQDFDIVITDVDLSEAGGTSTGGLSVLRAAREGDEATQVIVVTAYGKMEVRAEGESGTSRISVEEHAKRLRCFAFIPRPHPNRDYLDVVRETVAQALECRPKASGASSTAIARR